VSGVCDSCGNPRSEVSSHFCDACMESMEMMPEEFDPNIEQNNLADYDDEGDDEELSEDVGEDDSD
jgi:hypothetical protein